MTSHPGSATSSGSSPGPIAVEPVLAASVPRHTGEVRRDADRRDGERRDASHGPRPSKKPTPRKGLLRRLSERFNIYGVFWYKLQYHGVKVVPTFTYPFFACFFSLFFTLFLPRIRRIVQRNYDVVIGPCGWFERQFRVIRNIYEYAWCINERYEGLATSRQVKPVHENLEVWQSLRDSGSGFVLATAHIGHWDVASAYPTELQERHVHVVREEEADERSQEFFAQVLGAKERSGYSVHFANRDPNLGPKLLLAVRRGEIVALQADRPARGGRTLPVTLFGRTLEVPVGAAAIARSADVPILPVFVFRSARLTSHVVFREPIRVAKTADREADLHQAVERIAADVEWAIRQKPFQWFCFQDLWPEG